MGLDCTAFGLVRSNQVISERLYRLIILAELDLIGYI